MTGTDTPLVLLHALAVDARMWQSVADRLGELGRPVVALDQRGYAATPLGDDPASLDLVADDVAATLDRLGIDRCVLAGCSMGGYVALAFLRRHPERVAGLALFATRATPDDAQTRTGRLRFADAVNDPAMRPALVAAAVPTMVGATTRERRPEALARVQALVDACPSETVAWSQRAIAARADATDALAATSVPVLVVAGAEDELVALSESRATAQAAPGGEVVTIPGAGHLAPVETPDEVAELLAEFAVICAVTEPAGGTGTGAAEPRWGFASSTGQDFTHVSIVDAHFTACRDTYRALLDRAGIPRGAHVLDAGCGSGSFLPWLAEAVGPHGRVSAVDLADEHVALAGQNVLAWGLPTPIDIRRASVLDLPFDDGSLDAVWCANTVQYLDDDELRKALGEMRRVLRPGGVVAVKDLDASLVKLLPGDPHLLPDFFRREAQVPGYSRQLMRSGELYRFLREAGFSAVRQQTVLIEHFAPLTAEAADFYGRTCANLAARAIAAGLPGAWEPLLDTASADHPLDHPDGYICEGNVVAVGTA